MVDDIISELKEQYQETLTKLTRELGKIRTGRANVMMLDSVRVDYYGTPTPLNQIAAVKVEDPRSLTVTPWEKNLLNEIERAIGTAGLGLNPSNNGQLVRVPIPALTEERRQDLVKQARRVGENHKISLRNQRRDANDLAKKLQEDKEISEDELHRAYTAINGLTEKFTKKIDDAVEKREAEIMEV